MGLCVKIEWEFTAPLLFAHTLFKEYFTVKVE